MSLLLDENFELQRTAVGDAEEVVEPYLVEKRTIGDAEELLSEDVDLQSFVLDLVNNAAPKNKKGKKIGKALPDVDIIQRITEAMVERTIEGASTLTVTVHDEDRKLLTSGMFDRVIDVHVDDYWYRLDAIDKSDDDLTLVFIDRDVAYIRSHRKVKRATRGKGKKGMSRAEFCVMLVKATGKRIRVVCPELHKDQSVKKPGTTKSQTDAARHRSRKKGINRKAHLKVRHADGGITNANSTNIRVMEKILDVGVQMGASEKVLVCAIMTTMIEAGATNPRGGDRDSVGAFQQRRSMGWPATRIVEKDAREFFRRAIRLDGKDSGMGYGVLCQKVQGSAYPERYIKAKPQAQQVVDAYNGGDYGRYKRVTLKPYRFSTEDGGKPQNWWDAIGRLMDQVHWRRFMSNGVLYLISEEDLFRSKTRFIFTEETEGIHRINFSYDGGMRVSEITVTAQVKRWMAPPGSCVEVHGIGKASGKYLVTNIQRSLFNKEATIILKKPIEELPEPANATKTEGSTTATTYEGVDRIERMYRKAKAIHAKKYPYVWGGGHPHAGSPSGGGYDCSGSVGAVLAAGGFKLKKGDSVPASGTMMHWGVPGRGKYFTIYANGTHVFMEFHRKGRSEHFGTGDWGKGWRGAGFNPRLHPHSGFAVRHFKGY